MRFFLIRLPHKPDYGFKMIPYSLSDLYADNCRSSVIGCSFIQVPVQRAIQRVIEFIKDVFVWWIYDRWWHQKSGRPSKHVINDCAFLLSDEIFFLFCLPTVDIRKKADSLWREKDSMHIMNRDLLQRRIIFSRYAICLFFCQLRMMVMLRQTDRGGRKERLDRWTLCHPYCRVERRGWERREENGWVEETARERECVAVALRAHFPFFTWSFTTSSFRIFYVHTSFK